jgi:hypothetical protein
MADANSHAEADEIARNRYQFVNGTFARWRPGAGGATKSAPQARFSWFIRIPEAER